MKRLLVFITVSMLIVSLTGCSADSINKIVNTVGEETGVDVNLDLKQEDVDKVTDEINNVKDKVMDVAGDEKVKDALGNLIDAIGDAVEETESMSTETNLEP